MTDSHVGSIHRYSGRKKTHVARADKPLTFTVEFVENFRSNPPEEFALYVPSPGGSDPLRSAIAA